MTIVAETLDLRSARAILEKRRAVLLSDIRHDIRETCDGVETLQPEDAPDQVDASAVMAQSGIRLSLMQAKAEMLTAVNEALERVDSGSYGICESCGEPIAESRLRAMPFALRCTHCEEVREETEAVRRHGEELSRRLAEERRAYLADLR